MAALRVGKERRLMAFLAAVSSAIEPLRRVRWCCLPLGRYVGPRYELWVVNEVEVQPTLMAILLCIYPVVALTRDRFFRRRGEIRRAEMLCVHCGYNLTGNVSGVCPECGVSVR
jgi:hypothetical protein